ncbi:MAG: glycoside hydrolase family 32 protein [Bacteroidaceae bacterium]|nr:glycoside hydrolase family 32 protein [Bacteroidaceae bacterium]
MKSLTVLLFAALIPFMSQASELTFKVKCRYLNIPVSHQTERHRLTFLSKGVDTLSVEARLAPGSPDYWVFKDLSAYQGRSLRLVYDGPAEALSRIFQADTIMGQSAMYHEPNRPQFHFTTRRGWINDPNGLVWYDGEYHLYYQHNPYEREWGNMHWGHAVSRDLLHWQELDDALFPDALGTMFSGSAVVDYDNASGFAGRVKGQQGIQPPMVFAYTNDGAWETQCIAYSLDHGRTLHKYQGGRPVIDSHRQWQSHDTRDPRLLWYAPGAHWVMVLNERNGHSIYTSSNLRDWTYQSHVTGFWECPDLFELPVDGNPDHTLWVMYGASGTYMLGSFDGRVFTPVAGKYRYTTGSIYAAQTVSGTPDGRRIQIGWGRIAHPGMPFNGMMLLPTELTLRTTPDGPRLFSQPVREVQSLLHRQLPAQPDLTEQQANERLRTLPPSAGLHLQARLSLSYATSAGLRLDGQNIVDYDTNQNTLNGQFYSPPVPGSLDLDLDIYIDRTSVEVFVDGGRYSYSLERRPSDNRDGLQFWGRETTIRNLQADTISGIW